MSNAEYQQVIQLAKDKNLNLNHCPTCQQPQRELAPGIPEWTNDCGDCGWQDELRRRYLLAGIPTDYWTLSFDEFFGDPKALVVARDYLAQWRHYKARGIGVRFYAPELAVGKTTLACLIAKELIKRGERVYFTPFYEIIGLYQMPYEQREAMVRHLRHVTVLVLDEVGVGLTENQREFFAAELESLIRFRTSGNAVTILTTNMTDERLEEIYPRTFSLVAHKQLGIHVDPIDDELKDARKLLAAAAAMDDKTVRLIV